uniref:Uncharacterized protein n=1 Tax=Ditylenchus dipsaci TaxID=166011 RepID=A0A915EDP6_9BILA
MFFGSKFGSSKFDCFDKCLIFLVGVIDIVVVVSTLNLCYYGVYNELHHNTERNNEWGTAAAKPSGPNPASTVSSSHRGHRQQHRSNPSTAVGSAPSYLFSRRLAKAATGDGDSLCDSLLGIDDTREPCSGDHSSGNCGSGSRPATTKHQHRQQTRHQQIQKAGVQLASLPTHHRANLRTPPVAGVLPTSLDRMPLLASTTELHNNQPSCSLDERGKLLLAWSDAYWLLKSVK